MNDIGTLATTMLQWKLGHFFACYNENLGTLLHATMKIWAHFCMLQWKFGHFFSPAKTIFRTLCCMQQRNFWDFYFCNKANFPLGPSLNGGGIRTPHQSYRRERWNVEVFKKVTKLPSEDGPIAPDNLYCLCSSVYIVNLYMDWI